MRVAAMRFFGRDTKSTRGSVVVEPAYISCFWSKDETPVTKTEACLLYSAGNMVCRNCRGCQ